MNNEWSDLPKCPTCNEPMGAVRQHGVETFCRSCFEEVLTHGRFHVDTGETLSWGVTGSYLRKRDHHPKVARAQIAADNCAHQLAIARSLGDKLGVALLTKFLNDLNEERERLKELLW